MAHKKAGGTAKNLRDSGPQYLGVKIADGQMAKKGSILVRQRGTKIRPGKNVGMGKDHTLYSLDEGTVRYHSIRRKRFDGTTVTRKKAIVEHAG